MALDVMMKCLVVIADRGKAGRVCKVLSQHGLGIQYVMLAHGTAHSVFIDYLGLAEPEKEIVLALAPDTSLKGVLGDLSRKMQLDIPGKGIAFTVPLSSITKTAMEKAGGREEEKMEDTALGYELVVVTTETGLSETVVEAARKAGARGGTIVGARSVCTEDVKRVLGFTVQPEREVVLLLTPRDQRKAIMQAMCDCVRMETGDAAIAFSLPVSEVEGLVR